MPTSRHGKAFEAKPFSDSLYLKTTALFLNMVLYSTITDSLGGFKRKVVGFIRDEPHKLHRYMAVVELYRALQESMTGDHLECVYIWFLTLYET